MKKTKKQTGRSKTKLFFLNVGKVFIDMAKLCFGSLVLGIVIRGELPQETLLTAGIIATAVGALIGICMVSVCEEK